MVRRPGLNLDQHEDLGRRIKRELRPFLLEMCRTIETGLGTSHKAAARARRLLWDLDRLRSALDEDVCRQDERRDAIRFYYGPDDPSPVRA